MKSMWILAANNSFAKIYEVKGLGRHINEVHHFDNPLGRMKGTEIQSDRPGRSFDRMGPGRHALTKDHIHDFRPFAIKLAQVLYEASNNHAYEELAIVAPAQFLGELNHSLHESVRKMITKEIAKDLPDYMSEQECKEHFYQYFDLWNHEKSK